MKRFICASAILLWPGSLNAQLSKDELVQTAQKAIAEAVSSGEPKDRCSLGVLVGDDGRVLMSVAATPLTSGDTIKSVNGHVTGSLSQKDFAELLSSIAPNQSVSAEIVHNGVTFTRMLECTNARQFNAPIVAAFGAVAKKDFKGCVTILGAAPSGVQSEWHYRFLSTQCGIQARMIDGAAEPDRVRAWIAALIAEAKFVSGERSTAAQMIKGSEAYFRAKGRLDLWAPLEASLSAEPEIAAAAPPEPDWVQFRSAGEAAIKARLVDPSSAQFQWPYGFIYGTWKPPLARHFEGYWSCGTINARNRMGGYSGSSAFVVVLDKSGSPEFVDIGDGREFDLVAMQCAKSVKLLPPAPAQIAVAESAPVASVADELGKLAKLRDQGVLTEQEFEAQKAKLLGTK